MQTSPLELSSVTIPASTAIHNANRPMYTNIEPTQGARACRLRVNSRRCLLPVYTIISFKVATAATGAAVATAPAIRTR